MQKDGKYYAIIKGQELELKVTVGFWKRVPFTREEASCIETDVPKYFEALKLAVFYGNKDRKGWKCLEDMHKDISELDFEDTEVDYSQEISMTMIWYMPKKMRELTLSKVKEVEEKHEDMMKKAMDAMDETVQEQTTPDESEGEDEDPKKK